MRWARTARRTTKPATHWDMALDAAPAKERVLRSSAMNTRELMAYKSGADYAENKIELHRRFALAGGLHHAGASGHSAGHRPRARAANPPVT